jgi:protoporphyrinogen oxidase
MRPRIQDRKSAPDARLPTHSKVNSMENSTSQRWGIIGGGVLGMTVAHRLAQAGQDVTLIEAAPHLGGLADAWQLGDVTWDRHYHVTLLSDIHWRNILSELDLEDQMNWVETKTGFYTDGNLYSMSNNVEFLKFPPLRLIDKFRLGATIFYASKLKDWKKLEQIPVADWLRKLSGSRTFEKIWLPLLRAKLGENYQKTSAAFIWATIDRMYAARRTGLKKEMFGYMSGGYARILDAFTQQLIDEGVDVRVETPTRLVQPTGVGTVMVETAGGSRSEFDKVVMTTPSPVISKVCPALSEQEHSRHNGLQYQGIVCASVLLKKPLADFYVTNITESWVPFTAVIEMSTLVDRSEFGGHSLVYLPKYVAPDDPLFEESDASIQERFVSALEKMYPHFSRDDLLEFRISRGFPDDAELFKPAPADADIVARSPGGELSTHRQRNAQCQRDCETGRGHGPRSVAGETRTVARRSGCA